MIISEKNKYIYIANPKTGSTSVQKFLLEKDDSAKINSICLNGELFNFSEHYTASEIQKVLGDEYNSFTVFGFVRHPYSKVVSAYHFYRSYEKTPIKKLYLRVTNFFKVMSAKLLPFEVWALLYPHKSNKMYFTNADGDIIVEKIGLFENLNDDFFSFLNEIGVLDDDQRLPHVNKSKHGDFKNYIRNSFFKRLLDIKVGKDLEFYARVSSKRHQESF